MRAARRARERPVWHRPCQGRPLDQVLGEVEAACPPEVYDLLAAIATWMLDYEAQHANDDAMSDGFLVWLYELDDGNVMLPKVLPAEVVRMWHRLYVEDRAQYPEDWHVPFPFLRCDDCRFALPDHADRGPPPRKGINWESCPVCGSERLCWADFSKPAGHFLSWERSRMR